jgi:hypothetical protein
MAQGTTRGVPIDTDPLLANDSDLLVPSQKAVKAYADTKEPALGYTPATDARTLTINGTSQDLTSNRTWNVGDLLSSGSYSDPSWITSLAYSKLTGAPTIPIVGTWGALNYPTWTTGTPFVKMTAAGTFSLDLSTYVTSNSAITGATKTKITYDSKGLVTAGADATTADIADSTDKRYITDAQQTVVNNTSGTNTGDETKTSIETKLGAAATANSGYLTSTDWNTFNGKQKSITSGTAAPTGGSDGDIYLQYT